MGTPVCIRSWKGLPLGDWCHRKPQAQHQRWHHKRGCWTSQTGCVSYGGQGRRVPGCKTSDMSLKSTQRRVSLNTGCESKHGAKNEGGDSSLNTSMEKSLLSGEQGKCQVRFQDLQNLKHIIIKQVGRNEIIGQEREASEKVQTRFINESIVLCVRACRGCATQCEGLCKNPNFCVYSNPCLAAKQQLTALISHLIVVGCIFSANDPTVGPFTHLVNKHWGEGSS